jgi:hypothetical protein
MINLRGRFIGVYVSAVIREKFVKFYKAPPCRNKILKFWFIAENTADEQNLASTFLSPDWSCGWGILD